jgi:DNA-binding response OmpR family regulator
MAKVLVVEDDADFNVMVSSYLRKENHVVDSVDCAEEAKAYFAAGSPEVIILDWNLPDMEGVDLLKWIRAQGGNVAVIMLTGKGKIVEREQGLDSGADDYLIKPVSVRELAARIRAVLRRPSFVQNSLSIGGFELQRSSLSVLAGGKEIRLLPSEFAVLEFLARHPEEIFSAEVLLARVWNSGSEATTDSVRTAIKQIRKKVSPQIIETIVGAGYKSGK